MANRSLLSYAARVSRALRRSVAVVMASLVISTLVLPASTTVNTANPLVHLARPADGVGDSPVVD